MGQTAVPYAWAYMHMERPVRVLAGITHMGLPMLGYHFSYGFSV